MAPFPLPQNLVASFELWDQPGRREWLAGLEPVVQRLAERWSLRVGQPYQPGGMTAWVAPAEDAAGRELVLKVGWTPGYEAAHEADGLRVWAGRGAVRLHDALVDGGATALLLERARPGTALADSVPDLERDVVVAELLQRLWVDPPAGHPFRPLQSMCDAWAAGFEARRAEVRDAIDPGLARAGMELFRGLPGSAERDVLLCTDLHPGNVLAAEREPWLVIDPKPYLGDPAYDPLQHMLNFPERLAADPVGFARRMAGLTGLDAERVLLWLFARCVQESLDEPALRPVARRLAPV